MSSICNKAKGSKQQTFQGKKKCCLLYFFSRTAIWKPDYCGWKYLKRNIYNGQTSPPVIYIWDKTKMSQRMTKPTKWHVRPAKTQISLGIRPVWSESSLCAQRLAKDTSFLYADSVDSDQTGRMPRLIWVFAGRTCCRFCHALAQIKVCYLEIKVHRFIENEW